VEHAFNYAERMSISSTPPPAVLNISLISGSPYPFIESSLKGARYLTVMAAGNDGEQIDLVRKARYPVEYRRTAKDRVLTVAAHDGNGSIGKFSNYGPEVVDLAAPGCALETLTFDGKPVTSSGTSLAAPLVSLTAALLYSEGVVNPKEIRNRILTTTDFDPSLKERVSSSGRLNMEKALRIFQGIVVPLGADGKPVAPKFGELSVKEPMAICGDLMSLRDVMKIIPHYQDGVKPMLVLSRIGSEVGNVHCPAASDIEIEFTEEGGKAPRTFKLMDLHEIIPALR
jgi:subtilisin family serine protease